TIFLLSFSLLAIGSLNAMDMASIKAAKKNFILLVKKQKNAWMDFMKAEKMEKADLMQKHFNQMFDLKLKEIESMPDDLESVDPSQMLAMKREHLMECVRVYGEHLQEWERLCKEHEMKAKALGERTKDEFMRYKEMFMKEGAPVGMMIVEEEETE